MNLEAIHEWLIEYTGLDSASIGEVPLQEAVRDRISILGCESLKGYLAHLRSSAQERLVLVERVVVPETWFYRERDVLEWLASHANQVWAKRHPGQVFRVLCVPCWTGEESYSVAISLIDSGWPRNQLQVDGIDLGRENIRRARTGEYKITSFRGREFGFRERHLIEVNPELWQVPDSIRALVRFEQASLLAPGFAQMRAPYDAIFCRNLLMYFDHETQARALEVVDSLLGQDGVIAAGPGELEFLRARKFRSVSLHLPFVLDRQKGTR